VRASGGRLKRDIRLMGIQVHGVSFKKRAPRAIKEIRAFAEKAMVRGYRRASCSAHIMCDCWARICTREYWLTILQGTSDVRLDPQLNKKVWESGIKGVPFRLRVRISRKRNDEEGAKEKLYSYVQAVNVKDPKGLHTQVVEDA
jgi:large subunit ribosomal protein L31e